MWFLPYIVTIGLNFYPLFIRNIFMKSIDYGWSEKLGGQNLHFNLVKSRQVIQIMQNNNVKIYIIIFFL